MTLDTGELGLCVIRAKKFVRPQKIKNLEKHSEKVEILAAANLEPKKNISLEFENNN